MCQTFSETTPHQRYLIQDMSISCLDDRYRTYQLYAAFMILVYPIGIPLMYAIMLHSKRHILNNQIALIEEEKDHNPNIGHLMFLVESYKPQFYFFGNMFICSK
jgi:hypothetical protein